ncbi:MAG: glycosyltransferase family 2 protein [Candidatus Omnitrophota bacterium]
MMSKNTPYLSIVTPAYNEESLIEEIIHEWQDYIYKEKINAEIVVCNDGSADQTAEVLEKLKKKFNNLVVCENNPNKGYGYAVYNAVKHAQGELIMTLDSDGQFDVKEYGKLHAKLKEGDYDFVSGYRYKKKDTIARVVADRMFNLIMRIVFGLKFRDTNCAQKLYKAKIIKDIRIEARGYPAPTEIMVKASEMGAKIGEVGVGHYLRHKGASKLNIVKTSISVLKFLFYLRIKLFVYRLKIINSL